MQKPYQPPPYVEAELIADLKIGFPMIFSAKNIIDGDRFHLGYRLESWLLSARVVLHWQLAGEAEAQQMVAYSYQADPAAPGGFRWVCEW